MSFNFGSNLGATTAQPSFGFGAAKTNTPTFGTLGSTQTQPSGSITFGTPIASVAPTPQTAGLSFGASTPSTGLNKTQPTLNFAAPANQTGLNFGGTPSLNFGASTATTSLSFPTTTSLSFPTSTSLANPTTSANFGATNISFGTPVTTTTSTGLNFGLGGQTTSAIPTLNFKAPTTSTGLSFGFNTPKTQATTGFTLGTTTSTPVGLGGVDSSQLKLGTVSTGRTDTVAAKENQVPNEILQLIENFKQFVKDQKAQSSDVSRGSARPFIKVKEDIDLINSVLTDVGNDLQKNQQQADKLKHDSAKCLHNAEMAQRTNDTPPGLQFENNAPLRYFIELVNQFEQDLQALRVQIDVTDKHFQSLHEPKFLTSQELATGMRRLHDTFVALAGRLHSVHTQVETQKEQYLNLRKYILKDPTNIFIKPASKEEQALDVVLRSLAGNKSVSGPTPFSSFGSPFGINIQAQQNAVKPPPAYPTNTSLNFGSPASNLLGTATPQIDNFQLQSPPPGNKRGKR